MALDRSDFDNLGEADLRELVDNGVPESERIEYKRELYGPTDADKRELLKDVSALLNKRGGHLVIGIGTVSGIPVDPIGVPCKDADAEKLRLVSVLRTAIDPTPIGIRVREVLLSSGQYCIVVRVPQSWNPPHRVTFQGVNRFYVRNPGGVHEPSMTELRQLFVFGQGAADQARRFRDERWSRISGAGQARPLVGPGRMAIHLVPFAAFESTESIGLDRVMGMAEKFRPFGSSGFNRRINFEGVIVERGGERNLGYTQVFRNGIVEAAIGSLVISRPEYLPVPFIAAQSLEEELVRLIPSFIDGLCMLGVSAPIRFLATLQGVGGAHYGTRQTIRDYLDGPRVFEQDTLQLPECVIETYGTHDEYRRAIRPALDAIWNAMGDEDDLYYDGEGKWTGKLRR